MLAEFYEGNSGLDDILIEVGESFCKNKEEKRYLADALSKAGGYYGKYAADLYLQIGDEEQYLKKELGNLEYGSDYVRIAKYFKEKGDRPKSLDYIWEGMEKCKGKLDELIDYEYGWLKVLSEKLGIFIETIDKRMNVPEIYLHGFG